MNALNKPGRPRVYQHVIDGIKPEHGWVTLTEKQKTRTAPSAYRNRYPEADFRCIPNGDGSFSLQARKPSATFDAFYGEGKNGVNMFMDVIRKVFDESEAEDPE